MAKRIIVLEQTGTAGWRLALWVDVPTARQRFYADPNRASAFLDASAAELTALRSGAVAERVVPVDFDGTRTLAQKEATAQALWQAFQDEVNARNDWSRYGSSWDGTTWTFLSVP